MAHFAVGVQFKENDPVGTLIGWRVFGRLQQRVHVGNMSSIEGWERASQSGRKECAYQLDRMHTVATLID